MRPWSTAWTAESCSLAPVFGNGTIDRDALYWEHEGNRAIRVGDWKLVAMHGKPWEAYAARAKVAPWGEVHRKQR